MMEISEHTKNRIAASIAETEAHSSAELLFVLTHQSDDYDFLALFWAIVLTLSTAPAAFYAIDALSIYAFALLQWGLFFISLFLVRLTRWHLRFLPKQIAHRRASHHARYQFIAQGLNRSDTPPAAMLFVSDREHYVEILCNAKLDIAESQWQQIINAMIGKIQEENLEEALVEAVDAVGAVLKEAAPENASASPNHFTNRLVIL